MGEQIDNTVISKENRAKFIPHLLKDLKALDTMLEKGMIEDDIIRIGAEQEFCLVDGQWRPSVASDEILDEIHDRHFTNELAKYNLEINLDPIELKGNCFERTEEQLKTLLTKAATIAKKHHARLLLTGILPTLSKRELELEFMSEMPRYSTLNEVIRMFRGADFNLYIRGVDELSVMHDSVLFEACNTSFQMHLQIRPDDFVKSYNWAQAISAVVLGVSCNSPLLLGRELWHETRIALFQQSLDTRAFSYALKEKQPRVAFGNNWAKGSVVEIFKEDIARHPVLLSKEIGQDSLTILKNGGIPKLEALNLYNGTIYRWNRPCYGVGGNKPHLRIENRYIASGPSVIDQMANFAFWAGLMVGRPTQFDDMPNQMDFKDVKANFIKAARTGKESMLVWMEKQYKVEKLVLELLPVAYAGLKKMSVPKETIEHYLRVVERRTRKRTGATWQVKNYRKLKKRLKKDDALVFLTKSIFENQQQDAPVHKWKNITGVDKKSKNSKIVANIMSTQLFTVQKNDIADLVTAVMQWKNIHHMPVTDEVGKLCGLLTWTHMKAFRERSNKEEYTLVEDIMIKNVITASPKLPIPEALAIMDEYDIGCLPVISKGELVGIVSKKDF